MTVRNVAKCYKVALTPYSRARIVVLWLTGVWLPLARVYAVVISLVFLLCFQNDCMKAPVGDSDPILILGVGFQRLCFVVSCFSLVCG